MKRTEPKTGNVLPRNLKNSGTQTEENFDSMLKIANLEEQVKTLQLEINVLRKYMETSNKPNDIDKYKPILLTAQPSSKVNIEKSGCRCKKNCSLRICSCVKKNNKCNPSCRCDDTVCQNQVFKPRHQLSRTPPKNLEISFEERQLSRTPENLEIPLENSKHQLSLKKKTKTEKLRRQSPQTPQPEIENKIQLHSESIKEATNISPYKFEDIKIKEEQVDWQEHIAQLIPCKKCKRTFQPDRIQKHQACCKKI
ncbi:uncharacterized protein LOC105832906 [Monomorium pharaonis]|uniref:uncharacterized protein LOC105832906 n=1 Tax=Monomorium pharaonis TaxID=307658 RepID=UPI00063F738D|nr:uncharacterized protein LOC105832906 [Monomorium pharaonis]XP_028048188.1 uncharacterized protein LOC105832906 [Monomorium pharaonis]